MEIAKKLAELPNEIKKQEELVLEETIELETLKEKLDLKISNIEAEVADDKDVVTNKPLFTNEGKRKNEARIRMGKDEELKKLFDESKAKKRLLKLDEIKLNSLNNIFRSCRSIALLGIKDVEQAKPNNA